MASTDNIRSWRPKADASLHFRLRFIMRSAGQYKSSTRAAVSAFHSRQNLPASEAHDPHRPSGTKKFAPALPLAAVAAGVRNRRQDGGPPPAQRTPLHERHRPLVECVLRPATATRQKSWQPSTSILGLIDEGGEAAALHPRPHNAFARAAGAPCVPAPVSAPPLPVQALHPSRNNDMTRHPEVDSTEERLTLRDMKMYRAYRLVYRSREGSLLQLIGLPVQWHRSYDGLICEDVQ